MGVVVEVVQGGGGGQVREAQPAGQAAGFGGVDLDPQESFEGGGGGEVLGAGGVEDGGECFGGVSQPQVGQVGAELLVAARLVWWS